MKEQGKQMGNMARAFLRSFPIPAAAVAVCVAALVTGSGFLGVQLRELAVNAGEKTRLLPIYSVQRQDKKIAISFDAAWGNEHTKAILDCLDEYKVKTTFFLVEFWASKFPEDVKEIAKRGHELGNHSATHPNMTELSSEKIAEELNRTADTIESIAKVRPTVFRPPFGAYDNHVIQACEDLGYKVIQWEVDSLDWKDISAEQIVERVTRNVRPGSIVLFHNNAQYVEEYLPLILKKLTDDGYEIVPVGQLIYKDGYTMDAAGKQIPQAQ